MICIKWIRNNPESLDDMLRKRGSEPASSHILLLDKEHRTNTQKVENLYHEKKNLAQSQLTLEEKKEKSLTLKTQLAALEQQQAISKNKLLDALLHLPNILHQDTPIGLNETDNVTVYSWGEKPSFSFTPKHHSDFSAQGFNAPEGVMLSGSRFSVLRSHIALLEQALQRFMIDQHLTKGYELISAPFLVNKQTLINTGQLPKFHDDLFATQTDHWLIPTSEATLTSLVAKKTLREEELPLRFVALTPCFRREAGSAGQQTRGLIRQHQFTKVELVHIVHQEASEEALETLTSHAEGILKSLHLHYNKIMLCSGDIGFSAQKTYDLNVWMPGQNDYCEISSCSLCGTFQAQRMHTHYVTQDNKKHLAVTLNGSGLAVGRTLAAIIENYQTESGNIVIPEALRPYMQGKEII